MSPTPGASSLTADGSFSAAMSVNNTEERLHPALMSAVVCQTPGDLPPRLPPPRLSSGADVSVPVVWTRN